jgi:hypothetical protein
VASCHPAKSRNCDAPYFFQVIRHDHPNSAGLEARLYVSQDG